MSKDPFQILADEVTLIRGEIERLQRTSLDKDEAKALHQVVAKGVADINAVLPTLERSIERQLFDNREVIREEAVIAARDASAMAINRNHHLVAESAEKLLRDAQNVHRAAWRHFGNFWAWIGFTAALCLLTGSLATMAIQGRADAAAFMANIERDCRKTGNMDTQTTGGLKGCMVFYDPQ